MRYRITPSNSPKCSASLPECAIESLQRIYLNAQRIYLNELYNHPNEFTQMRYRITSANLLKVGLGISRTNADSQWNPVYNAFHRDFCCGKETIRR